MSDTFITTPITDIVLTVDVVNTFIIIPDTSNTIISNNVSTYINLS